MIVFESLGGIALFAVCCSAVIVLRPAGPADSHGGSSGSPLDPGGQEEVICSQISVGAVS